MSGKSNEPFEAPGALVTTGLQPTTLVASIGMPHTPAFVVLVPQDAAIAEAQRQQQAAVEAVAAVSEPPPPSHDPVPLAVKTTTALLGGGGPPVTAAAADPILRRGPSFGIVPAEGGGRGVGAGGGPYFGLSDIGPQRSWSEQGENLSFSEQERLPGSQTHTAEQQPGGDVWTGQTLQYGDVHKLAAQQRQLLPVVDDHLPGDLQKLRRERNRMAQRNYRLRQKRKIEELEQEVRSLKSKIHSLEIRNAELERELQVRKAHAEARDRT